MSNAMSNAEQNRPETPSQPDPSPAGMMPAMEMWRLAAIDIPTRLGAEVTGFMMHRLQAQADQWACLIKCRSIDEVIDRQASFARSAMEDYSREATVIAEDLQDVMNKKFN